MQQAVLALIYVLAFMAIVAAVQAFAAVFFSSRDRVQRTNRRLAMLASGMEASEVYASLVLKPFDGVGRSAYVTQLYNRFALYCRQAGVEGSPLRLLATFGIASLCLWLTSILLLRSGSFAGLIMNGLFALPVSGMLCGLIFWVWLSRRRAKRLKILEEQMPLALDVINRAIRSGHPVISAVKLAGEEMGDPIGSEFGLIVDETTYGFEFRDALTNFARRTGSADAHFFAVSVGVQAETGGNLAEILDGLAVVIRSRTMLGKRVRSLSSEGRASAMLLSVLPAGMIAFMFLTRPTYYTSKFPDPIFWPTVSGVFVLYLVGLLVIRRIINFKY